eukprot:8149811-Pyramimonas_sp.AAC.1
MRRKLRSGECTEEELKMAKMRYRRERRKHRRNILEYEFRPSVQHRAYLKTLRIEGEHAWDKSMWERALREHRLRMYTDENERARTDSTLE